MPSDKPYIPFGMMVCKRFGQSVSAKKNEQINPVKSPNENKQFIASGHVKSCKKRENTSGKNAFRFHKLQAAPNEKNCAT